MNNVQKSFKQKAKLGLRAFASGGLLDSFNTRQQGWDAIANNGGGMGVLQNSAVDDWNAGFDARRAAEAAAPQVRRTIMPAAQPVVPDAAPQSLRGFAGGGEIDPVEAQLAAMKAKYGVGNQSQPAAPAPAPQAAPQPAPRPQQKPTLLDGLRRVATGGLEQRMKAAGYQHGGDIVAKVKKGGWIEGQKGVDKVPAKIAETGESILVSDGERIVNKEQNEALEKLAAEHGMELDEYLEQSTGKPVGPKLKNGLRAAENGADFEIDPAGNARRPGQVAGALPNPNGNAGANFKADPSAIDVEFKTVPKPAPALSAPAPVVQPPSTAQMMGRAVGKGLRQASDWVKANPGKIMGAAGDAASVAMAAYNAHRHGDFYNSDEVPFVDKLGQAGRDIVKSGVPIVTGAIGTGLGTVAAPTLVVNPITGGIAGSAAGLGLVAGLDQDSDAFKAFAAKQARANDPRVKAHNVIMQDGYGGGSGVIEGLDTPEQKKAKMRANAANEAKAFNAVDADTKKRLAVGPADGENANIKGLRAAGVGPDGVNTIDTVNGKVYTGRDAKGQLHITSNLDQTPAAADAARAKEAERITADLARQKDYFERAGAKRDLEADITDPSVRAAAAQRLAQLNTEADDRIQSERNKEEMGLRRAMLDMQGAQLKENARQFDEGNKLRRDMASAQLNEKRVKELDDLIDAVDWGDKEKNARWKDFMYANGYAADGTALSPQEIRKQMPTLKAKFDFTDKARLGALDGTTLGDISGGKKRRIRLSDIDTNAWGLPLITSDDPRKMSFTEYMQRAYLNPEMSPYLYVDPQNNRYRLPDVRGSAGSMGSSDVDKILGIK